MSGIVLADAIDAALDSADPVAGLVSLALRLSPPDGGMTPDRLDEITADTDLDPWQRAELIAEVLSLRVENLRLRSLLTYDLDTVSAVEVAAEACYRRDEDPDAAVPWHAAAPDLRAAYRADVTPIVTALLLPKDNPDVAQ